MPPTLSALLSCQLSQNLSKLCEVLRGISKVRGLKCNLPSARQWKYVSLHQTNTFKALSN